MIEASIKFYKRYTNSKDEALIKEAIQKQLGSQQEEAAERRIECKSEIERIYGLVLNLLDHIKAYSLDIFN